MRRFYKLWVEVDAVENVPDLPEMKDGEYIVEIDPTTGKILREGV